MAYRDRTDIGGVREAFLTTHWSLIEDVKNHEDKDRALIGLLLERYWKPVYCYVRRQGYDNEQAKDLTQGFFHEVVLNRHLVQRADPSKGRFRTFILHALCQYLAGEQRKENARKRIPRAKLVSLDAVDPAALPASVQALDPEGCFDHVWKTELLDRVLSELQERYVAQGMAAHWYLFRDRLMDPSLESHKAPSLADLCQKYGIANEAQASNMLGTVKRQFRNILQKHIRQTVASNQAAADELKEMFKFFQK
jgi:DNA-directed RNA polymerase specialized sigma24 family protein